MTTTTTSRSDQKEKSEDFSSSTSTTHVKPSSWLLSTISDMEERIKMVSLKITEAEDTGDTFAERAESYYNKRPQLLALLQDLYNAYTALSNRYAQTVTKHHRRHSSQTSTFDQAYSYHQEEEYSGTNMIESDAESSLSYQQPPIRHSQTFTPIPNRDTFIAELVVKNVEYDILLNEVTKMDRHHCESSRKIELQKSLLEVLESERLILLNQNAKLGSRVNALAEQNKGLEAESVFMKKKVSEMARCVLKMRDDHKVYMLNRKIEDLQGQIYGLENRNREYYEQIVKKEGQEIGEKKMQCKEKEENAEVGVEVCFQIGKTRLKRSESASKSDSNKKGFICKKWWERVKNMDLFQCGDPVN